MTPPPAATPEQHPRPQNAWRVGKVAGIPLDVSRQWPVGALIMAAVYATSYLATGVDTGTALLLAGIAVVVLMVSVVLHEGSHALVAKLVGHEVQGVTLTLWGGFTSSLVWHPRPWKHALVAASGPLMNLALAAAAVPLTELDVAFPVRALFQSALWINLFLGLFNLLPGLPMDGGAIVEALAWRLTRSRSTGELVGAWGGRIVALLVAAWALWPLLDGSGGGNWWTLFIAIFLWLGASRTLASARGRRALERVTMADVTMPGILVPADATLMAAMHASDDPRRIPILFDGRRVLGIVAPQPVDPTRPDLPAAAVALPCLPDPVDISPTDSIGDVALSMRMREHDVVVGRYPTGEPRVITAANILNGMQRASEAAKGGASAARS